jgi:hypothetical protein
MTTVCSKIPFEVCAYDKDNDVYTTMHTTPSETLAMRIADSLKGLIENDMLRRRCSDGSYEPYDWITVFQGDKVVATV